VATRKKIAAIVTSYYPRSHADVVITKFLKGFPCDDGLHVPQVDIVSMYLDQIHQNDVGVELAREHGVPIYQSIPGALTLGGKKLAVDGVLIIGEHGDYAWNEKDQHLYPRRFFFEQVCGVFATSNRSVPVFSDKHLAYNWKIRNGCTIVPVSFRFLLWPDPRYRLRGEIRGWSTKSGRP